MLFLQSALMGLAVGIAVMIPALVKAHEAKKAKKLQPIRVRRQPKDLQQ